MARDIDGQDKVLKFEYYLLKCFNIIFMNSLPEKTIFMLFAESEKIIKVLKHDIQK